VQDFFLKLTGIDGESQDATHAGEIELICWDWEITQKSSMHSGSGGGAGKATVGDFIFDKYVDRATPNLFRYCMTGKHIQSAVLVARKAGGSPLEYLKLTMDDVVVTGVNSSAAPMMRNLREEIRLSFARVKQEYVIQNLQGGSGGTVTAAFDIQANKEI
jgi:type VI secretion system secreted protein Hcp